jgi:hypothetical protein
LREYRVLRSASAVEDRGGEERRGEVVVGVEQMMMGEKEWGGVEEIWSGGEAGGLVGLVN